MMKEERIKFATAKLLKEKGFTIATYGSFTEYLVTQKSDNPSFRMKKGEVEEHSDYMMNNGPGDFSNKNYVCYSRPTQDLVCKWLRDLHDLHVQPLRTFDSLKQEWKYLPTWGQCIPSRREIEPKATYEEAMEVAIVEALKLIK